MAAATRETLGLVSQILSIAEVLLRPFVLKVPRYQRPYTWGEREVQRLIQDLLQAYRSKEPFYFIGQIVLVKGDKNQLEISDGQQRLATLTMILAYVRDRLPGRAAQYQSYILTPDRAPRLLLRGEDANFFHGKVQEPGNMVELATMQEIGVDSKDRMREAARTIQVELKMMNDRELDTFISYVMSFTLLNVIDAAERSCAATVYNTVNDRGLELSAADNIKCDLLENSGLTNARSEVAAQKWEELEDKLGRWNFAKLLGHMPFLLTGGDMIAPSNLASFRRRIEASGGVDKFLFDRLPRYAAALLDILHLRVDVGAPAINADINRRIKMLMQIDKEWPWAPAAIACLAERRGRPEHIRRFFEQLDCYAFACLLTVIAVDKRLLRFGQAAQWAASERVGEPGAPISLTDSERLKVLARLGEPFRSDRQQRRLMLIRAEAAMANGSVLSVRDDATVEHILPRTAGGAWWAARFPNKERREREANLLGNFVLITERQNKDADDSPFPDKKQVYFKTPGAPIHALTRMIERVPEWTHEEIGARQDEIVRTLTDDWGLQELH